MKIFRISMAALFAVLCLCAFIQAQSAADCANLMKFGVYDKFKTFSTETHYKQIKEFFENNTFSSSQQAESKAGELGLDIVGILGLKFGGNSSSTNFQQWRQSLIKSTYMEALSLGMSTTSIETVSGRITQLVEVCLRQKGVHAYVIPAQDNQNFTVTVDFVPISSSHPETMGTISITPSSVASQCSPSDVLGSKRKIGPQGISVACRRLPSDTVTVIANTDDGSPSFTYDAYVIPKPTVDFRATKDTIDSGETTRLIWDVRDALRVNLEGFGQVAESGTRDVTPSTTTEYKLSVTSLGSEVTNHSKIITVIPPPPTLVSARVQWHTTTDNKDHDTTAAVHIKCGGNVIASVSGQWGEFKDPSSSGWKNLNIVEKPKKAAILGICTAQAREDPNGDDEWHFNWELELRFSDGSVKHYVWNGENLAEDRRETSIKGL